MTGSRNPNAKPRAQRANPAQKRILVSFMEQNPELVTPAPSRPVPEGQLTRNELWQNVTLELNRVIGGAKKTPKEWRECWTNLKSKLKTDIVERINDFKKSGDGGELTTAGLGITNLVWRIATISGFDEIKKIKRSLLPSSPTESSCSDFNVFPVKRKAATTPSNTPTKKPSTAIIPEKIVVPDQRAVPETSKNGFLNMMNEQTLELRGIKDVLTAGFQKLDKEATEQNSVMSSLQQTLDSFKASIEANTNSNILLANAILEMFPRQNETNEQV